MKSEYRFGMIGPSVKEIERGIEFIDKNYNKSIKLQPADWDLLIPDEYVVYVKFNIKSKQNNHIKLINNMLDENNFECKLYDF